MTRKIFCGIAMGLSILYCVCLIVIACNKTEEEQEPSQNPSSIQMGYEEKIFNSGYVHEVRIEISTQEWEDLKLRALYKECYDSTVTIDGETYHHVGIRTKGNVTLIQSIVRDWDRYSLVLEFDAFDSGNRYYGLDQLVLNNNVCDSSFMRDYLVYDMMRYMGVPAPLCSFTAVYLNGEYLGLYTTIENMQESFAVRNFGYEFGNIYKPEQMNLPGMLTGEEKDATIHLGALSGEEGTVDAAAFMGVTDKTVGLQYQGKALANYADIWDNAVFKVGTSDKRRVVDAIQIINAGEDVSNVLFTEELLRYFAVNAFVLNDDCYTSYAGHNYGLYEKDGRLMILPWDYDHSLGCMGAASGSSSWTEIINLPIDEPLIGTTMEERPLLNCLLSNEEYKEQYYSLLDEFLTEYIESGRLEENIDELTELLLPYIQREPEDGVTEESFFAAIDSNLDFCGYRAASIRGQLSGTIPKTTEGQKAAPETLIDCSEFVSPDSGSLTELLFPEGSGIYFEHLIGRLVPRLNAIATVQILPIEDMVSLLFLGDDSEDGLINKLENSGRVKDKQALRDGIMLLIKLLAEDLVEIVLVPVVLIGGLMFAFTYGKKRHAEPRKRKKGGEGNAV